MYYQDKKSIFTVYCSTRIFYTGMNALSLKTLFKSGSKAICQLYHFHILSSSDQKYSNQYIRKVECYKCFLHLKA